MQSVYLAGICLAVLCSCVVAHDDHQYTLGKQIPNCAYIQTSSDVLGPYFYEGAPFTDSLLDPSINYTDVGAQLLLVEGYVYLIKKNETTEQCYIEAYQDSTLDVWHADFSGEYDNVAPFFWRARRTINETGGYSYFTVYPGKYGGRPIHVHLMVSYNKTGELGQKTDGFVTQMYFQQDNDSSTVPSDLRTILQDIEVNGEIMKYTTFNFYINAIPDETGTTGWPTGTTGSASSLQSFQAVVTAMMLVVVLYTLNL